MQTMTILTKMKNANYRQNFDRYDHMISLYLGGTLRSKKDEMGRPLRAGQSFPV